VALDVGHGQLHEKLRQDERVTSLERTNARTLEPGALPGPDPVELVTLDASFISATRLLPAIAAVAPVADVLVLVKPQFEVARGEVGKGGVVRDDGLRARAADDVQRCAESLGYEVLGRVDSELPGPKGNREIFLWLCHRPADQKKRNWNNPVKRVG
jgi:23S rRNA (cytidine1920-2'-O)/16S rRNA (cytidine1409-2'-O)-methyltransferase